MPPLRVLEDLLSAEHARHTSLDMAAIEGDREGETSQSSPTLENGRGAEPRSTDELRAPVRS
jgi:hypothetical protein